MIEPLPKDYEDHQDDWMLVRKLNEVIPALNKLLAIHDAALGYANGHPHPTSDASAKAPGLRPLHIEDGQVKEGEANPDVRPYGAPHPRMERGDITPDHPDWQPFEAYRGVISVPEDGQEQEDVTLKSLQDHALRYGDMPHQARMTSVPEAEPQEQELTMDQAIDNLIGAVRNVDSGKYTQGAINKGRADILAAAHREYAQPTTLGQHLDLAGIPQGALIERVEHGIKWSMPDSAAQPGKGG